MYSGIPFDGTLFLREYTSWAKSSARIGSSPSATTGSSSRSSAGRGTRYREPFGANREFALAVQEPMPVQIRLKGSIREGDIEADIESISLDVDPLQRLLRFPFFSLTGGIVTGTNIRVSGPINDPDFSGVLEARNIRAQSEVIPEPIGPFNGVLGLDQQALAIQGLTVPVGLGTHLCRSALRT